MLVILVPDLSLHEDHNDDESFRPFPDPFRIPNVVHTLTPSGNIPV